MKLPKTLTSQKPIRAIGAGVMWNVKKYRNRKYYLAQMGHNDYINLEDMRKHVEAGGQLKVVDKTTKMDITGITVATMNYQAIKRQWGVV